MNTTLTPLRKAKGSVLVLTALSLLVILGMAGLTIDLGHSYSNKTRLQNSVDAAAIGAAMKLLDQVQALTGAPAGTVLTFTTANAAGSAIHQSHLASFGNQWLTGATGIEFCWSTNLQDFSNCLPNLSVGAGNPNPYFFVRARVTQTALNNFIMQIIPGIGATRSVGAVAVAGTIGTISDCNVAPFFVCDNSADPAHPDTNCSDGACFGNPVTTDPNLPVDDNHYFGIKMGSQDDIPATNGCTNADGCVWVSDKAIVTDTPTIHGVTRTSAQWNFNSSITFNGNRLLLNMVNENGQQQGAATVKDNILYSNACVSPGDTDTQPGNVSAIDQAFNGLFGEPGGPYQNQAGIQNFYDWLIDNPISFRYYYLEYLANSVTYLPNSTRYHQRLKNVPVVQCPSPMGGNLTDLNISGYACFFMARKMYQPSDTGNLTANEDFIIAEHVDNKFCPPINGIQGGNPANILDAKIVLFESYETSDS